MIIRKYAARMVGIILLAVLMCSCGISKNLAITCPVYPYKGNRSTGSHIEYRRGYPHQGRIVGKKQHTGTSRKIQNRKER
jgi:hypothetical protein